MEMIPALSLWQPWASLIFTQIPAHENPYTLAYAKAYETRPRPLFYRGPLLIHAALRWRPDQEAICRSDPFRSALRTGGFYTPDDIPRGCILGLVWMRSCQPTETVAPKLHPLELSFGDFSAGRYAYHLRDPDPFPSPLPYRGQQGLFRVPIETILAHHPGLPPL